MGFIFAAPHPPPRPCPQLLREQLCEEQVGVEGGDLHLKILVGWPETLGAIADPVLCVHMCVHMCMCVCRVWGGGAVGEKTLGKWTLGVPERLCTPFLLWSRNQP